MGTFAKEGKGREGKGGRAAEAVSVRKQKHDDLSFVFRPTMVLDEYFF
jgi:hypothetical protein